MGLNINKRRTSPKQDNAITSPVDCKYVTCTWWYSFSVNVLLGMFRWREICFMYYTGIKCTCTCCAAYLTRYTIWHDAKTSNAENGNEEKHPWLLRELIYGIYAQSSFKKEAQLLAKENLPSCIFHISDSLPKEALCFALTVFIWY